MPDLDSTSTKGSLADLYHDVKATMPFPVQDGDDHIEYHPSLIRYAGTLALRFIICLAISFSVRSLWTKAPEEVRTLSTRAAVILTSKNACCGRRRW